MSTKKPAISQKWCKIGPMLLWRTNRKSHTRFRSIPKWACCRLPLRIIIILLLGSMLYVRWRSHRLDVSDECDLLELFVVMMTVDWWTTSWRLLLHFVVFCSPRQSSFSVHTHSCTPSVRPSNSLVVKYRLTIGAALQRALQFWKQQRKTMFENEIYNSCLQWRSKGEGAERADSPGGN